MLKEHPDWSDPEVSERVAKSEAALAKNLKNNSPAKVAWVARQFNSLAGEVAEEILNLRETVKDLEARLNIAEAKSMHYQGVYSKDTQFNAGDVVTHRGTLWHCEKSTRSTPGGGPASGWRLMAKTQQGAKQ